MMAQGGGKDMSTPYFYIEALENGMTASLSREGLSYSIDECQTWTSLGTSASPSLNAGDKIYFKGSMTPLDAGIGTFSVTKQCNVGGNIMSLLFADDFVGQDDLTGYNYAFFSLFEGETNLISAENLILPATTLAKYCYYYMFYGCSGLTTAPELPATTLTDSCYEQMFRTCTSLRTAPELPATTLARRCYNYMFGNCSRLNYIKMLATNISASNCLTNWVYSVASSGTFVKNKDATWTKTGNSGVPSGWTIEYE